MHWSVRISESASLPLHKLCPELSCNVAFRPAVLCSYSDTRRVVQIQLGDLKYLTRNSKYSIVNEMSGGDCTRFYEPLDNFSSESGKYVLSE